jgi:hypothetical protein
MTKVWTREQGRARISTEYPSTAPLPLSNDILDIYLHERYYSWICKWLEIYRHRVCQK